jgi:predicted transcriptional regulator of viral defense system
MTVYKKLKSLNLAMFQTNDISILLGVSNKYGHKLLKDLSKEKLIIHLRRNLWGLTEVLDPLMLPDYLTAPMPSYISLQSALYYHGLISQIPEINYVISIARTRCYKTPVGVYSIHHINPSLFSGFDSIGEHAIHMAEPEKALFDFFYLKSAKNKLFYALPEIEIPNNFKWKKLKDYAQKIENKSRQSMVISLIDKYKAAN